MNSLDTTTLHAIAESAQSAALRAGLGDRPGAEAALRRAERHLGTLSTGLPPHARVVRLAREAVERARLAIEHMGGQTVTRRAAGASVRAAGRAAARAKA